MDDITDGTLGPRGRGVKCAVRRRQGAPGAPPPDGVPGPRAARAARRSAAARAGAPRRGD